MNGGSGTYSYVQNSAYQRSVMGVAKSIIEDEIGTKLDVKKLCSSSATAASKPNDLFCIADFGCATGDNSFAAIQMIIKAIEKKLLILDDNNPENNIPEFQVFFNDRIKNDFNTLFNSLPSLLGRNYHAAGVLGTFYGRLFPQNSLHFAYSSWSLHWLSEVPDTSFTNRNKWKLYYQLRADDDEYISSSGYSGQFVKDMESFLEGRAKEVVVGGMMALLLPGVPHSMNPDTDFLIPHGFSLLGSCLQDMADEGRIIEAKLESFNFPIYFPTPQELKAIIIERCPSFEIDRMETLKNPGRRAVASVKASASMVRSVTEELFTSAFGTELDMDELFDRYTKKIAASPLFLDRDNDKNIVILVVLTRKPHRF